MCATPEEVQQFSNKRKKGSNKMGERNMKVCQRILFELYNQYPESTIFRECSDLNFEEYLAKIKEPIALDIIKEKLIDEDHLERVRLGRCSPLLQS